MIGDHFFHFPHRTHRSARGHELKATLARGALALALCGTGVAAQAQSITVNQLNWVACGTGAPGQRVTFAVTYAGLAAPTGPWDVQTVVTQGAATLSTTLTASQNWPNGTAEWSLGGPGQVSNPAAITAGIPFTTTITVSNQATGTPVSRTTVTVNDCANPTDNATITSNQTVMLNGAGASSVPTLGEWGLMLTGLAAAVLGMRRLRRRTV
ncbi:IPTL-CTERM sorting domain-containing protein [Ottowia testudinis]|uniref:IPTL-CTERM sorting domain-containing protein n=1 Tax=Ottowia testudinis TaxID=2816950 RepID=A0A975H4R0_9BURK|nr:IPTL-CTERM sorting domain-containing protein [Ottowia testudinis]QTD44177.1 IPTL-CTERM sorting domain-containing protein [Ottowia testudinis]